MGRRGMHIGYWWEKQNETVHWEDTDVGEWTIIKCILKRSGGLVCTASIWLRIRTGGGLL
jgi:hypothetical protein